MKRNYFHFFIAAALLCAYSSCSFSLSCPAPSSIKYLNGQWTAPDGWNFNQIPEINTKHFAGRLVDVEWQAMTKGDEQGSVEWCQYNGNGQEKGESIRLSWWGNPMFVSRKNKSAWRNTGDGKTYICRGDAETCSFDLPKF